jgi:predicted RND superfamily exporter protein
MPSMRRTVFERLVDFSLRHARVVVAATFTVTLVFGWFAAKVKVNPDFISLLPKDAEVNALLAEYGASDVQPDVLVFAVTADRGDVLEPAALAAYGEAVTAIAALPGVQSTISPFNLVNFGRESGRLAIRLMSPGGVAPDAGHVDEFRARLAGTRYARNLVVSGDGRMLISYFQTESMGSFKQLMVRVDDIAATVRTAGLTPYVTGTIPINVRTEYHLSRDATRLLLLAALIILVSYLASYRSPRGVILPFLSVLLGTVWTVGFMSMAGFPLSLITIVAPPLILIFGNEYAVYATSEYLRTARADAVTPGWIARATRSVAAPIVMAVLTTAIGFLSLLSTSIRQTREFAVTASFGSLACAFLALFFLPAMYSLLRPPVVRSHEPGGAMERAMRSVAAFCYRRAPLVLGLLGAVVVLFAVTIRMLTFNTDPASYFPAADPVLRDMRVIYDHAGGYEQMAVSFDAPDGKAGYFLDADILARVQEVERKLRSLADVSYALSLPDLLQEVNRAATGEDVIPSNRASILTFSRLLTAAGGSSPGGALLSSLVDRNFSRVTVICRIYNADTRHYMDEARTRTLLSDMRKVVADTPIGAPGVVWGDLLRNLSFADMLRRTLGISMAMSMLSILALTVVVFRSFRFGFYPVVPLAAGLLLNYALMALVGIPLDMTTIMVSNIAIGAGVDNAIYLVIQYRRELARSPRAPALALGDTLTVMGPPALLSSLSIIAGMLVFTTAAFRPVVYFGLLVLFTLLATLGGTLITLPAILAMDTRIRIARGRHGVPDASA